jgi:hypothetical protein
MLVCMHSPSCQYIISPFECSLVRDDCVVLCRCTALLNFRAEYQLLQLTLPCLYYREIHKCELCKEMRLALPHWPSCRVRPVPNAGALRARLGPLGASRSVDKVQPLQAKARSLNMHSAALVKGASMLEASSYYRQVCKLRIPAKQRPLAPS